MQALKPKTNYTYASVKQKFHETSKNDRPTKDSWQALKPKTNYPHASDSMKLKKTTGHPKTHGWPQGTPQFNSPSAWAELKKQSSRKSKYKNDKHGRN